MLHLLLLLLLLGWPCHYQLLPLGLHCVAAQCCTPSGVAAQCCTPSGVAAQCCTPSGVATACRPAAACIVLSTTPLPSMCCTYMLSTDHPVLRARRKHCLPMEWGSMATAQCSNNSSSSSSSSSCRQLCMALGPCRVAMSLWGRRCKWTSWLMRCKV
jgi:hypothetical protein